MNESKGLGDTIAKVAKATKVNLIADKIAKSFGKEDCGCKKRQQLLNEKFPFKNK